MVHRATVKLQQFILYVVAAVVRLQAAVRGLQTRRTVALTRKARHAQEAQISKLMRTGHQPGPRRRVNGMGRQLQAVLASPEVDDTIPEELNAAAVPVSRRLAKTVLALVVIITII